MTILRLDKPFKVKLFFQCGTKKKRKENQECSCLSLPVSVHFLERMQLQKCLPSLFTTAYVIALMLFIIQNILP